MKTIKIILIAVLFISAYSASAQWSTNGSNVYYNGGNVGIGTSTPSSALNIYSPSTAYLNIESPYSGTGSPAYNISAINLKNTTTGDLLYIGLRKRQGAHDMVQSVYDASTSTWREFIYFNFGTRKYEMRAGVADAEFKNTGNILFNNTGALGIGTGTTVIPVGTKLAVNGKVLATEVQVALVANWADYVFDEDYNLKPLSEIENFIKENKHLPDVPSANQIAKNGVNLGEMDAILLQKIEELTLYMIDLKKENELLKEQIKSINQ